MCQEDFPGIHHTYHKVATQDFHSTQPATVRLRYSAAADVPFDPKSAELLEPVVKFITDNVPPDGYILEIPSSLCTFLTGRRQAARLDHFLPKIRPAWDARREIDIIQKRKPLYVIERTDGWIWDWRRGFPEVDRYVREHFRPHRRFGPIAIWARKEFP